MHGRTIRAHRTPQAQQQNQIASSPNKQRSGGHDHHEGQINEDRQMFQGKLDRIQDLGSKDFHLTGSQNYRHRMFLRDSQDLQSLRR